MSDEDGSDTSSNIESIEDYNPFETDEAGKIRLKSDDWAFSALSRQIFGKREMKEIYAQGEAERRREEFQSGAEFAWSRLGKPKTTQEEIKELIVRITRIEIQVMKVVSIIMIIALLMAPQLDELGYLDICGWIPAFGLMSLLFSTLLVWFLRWGADVDKEWSPFRNI